MADASAHTDLVEALLALHKAVGSPTPAEVHFRIKTTGIARNTVHELIKGKVKKPNWKTVEAFLPACWHFANRRGVQLPPEWKDLEWWKQLHKAQPPAAQPPSDLLPDSTLDSYWDTRARGVETAHIPGMYFTGRRRALTELVEWLVANPHPADTLRVVTGGPGSGKSSVLARLVTRSDPGFRSSHPLTADDPLFVLPEGAVDAAVDARGLDSSQVLQALATGLGSRATDVDALLDTLACQSGPITVVVDGLDESTEPRRAAGLLRRLACDAADFGVRLLVGTRAGHQRGLLLALGVAAVRTAIDLDFAAYLDRADLAQYVRRRLLFEGAPPEATSVCDTPYRGKAELADRVAARVADRAYPSFLIAALTAVGLVRSGTVADVDQDGWDRFPATVADAMRTYLDRFSAADADRVEDLLRPLAYVHGEGLPVDELWARLASRLGKPGRTYRVEDICWLLAAADYLLEAAYPDSAGGAEPVYRLYHQALAEHVRDQDRARGVPAEEMVYQLLLESVPHRLQQDLDWKQAHPYIRDHLADHAAATGHLDELVDDPGFLLMANPSTLTARLQQAPWITTSGARTYHAAAHLLAEPADRLFQLQLHAARLRETTFERRLAAFPVEASPRLAWTSEPRHTPHYTLARYSSPIAAVAIAALDGYPLVVCAGKDCRLHVWDLTAGALVGDPLTGHTGPIRAVVAADVGGR
ncbi:hypothetical protein, partial [Nocardia sp. NPDC047038]|uniref:hypothetical protein n=1 Tax=Nocardia sp. NPDC047038 TaxID=3154338 RepID=UPI0033D42001